LRLLISPGNARELGEEMTTINAIPQGKGK